MISLFKRFQLFLMPVSLIFFALFAGVFVGVTVQAYDASGTGAFALSPDTLRVEKGKETTVCPNWPLFDVKVNLTNVEGIVGCYFSVRWNPDMFDLIEPIVAGDYLDPAPGGKSSPMYGLDQAAGELLEWSQIQYSPFAPKTFTTPSWGWVATLTFNFTGTPPSIGSPVDTDIVIINEEAAHKGTFWTPDGLTWNEFAVLGTCHFHYEAVETLVHDVEGFNVVTVSKSIVSNVTLVDEELKQLRFNVTGQAGMTSFCNVTIPKALLKAKPLGDWIVTVDGEAPLSLVITDNATHTFVDFTYNHTGTQEVIIQGTWVVPEFPTSVFLLLLMIATIAATMLEKKVWSIKRRERII